MKRILDNFIVLEGLDGSGTTTQLKEIVERFDMQSIPVHATFEPTGSPFGKIVRSVLKKEIVTTPLALAHLFAADREDHLHNPVHGITGMIEKGETIICDRYLFSSLAYQSIECGYEKVEELNDFPYPRFIFYIDTPTDVCMERIYTRNEETELFEEHSYLNKVREFYERAFSTLPEEVNFIRIDGRKTIEEITVEIESVLKDKGLL